MSIDIELTCPLGHTCEEAVDGRLRRCAWYTRIAGKHPQSEEIVDEWCCAIAWQPILMVEMSQTNRGQTQAIEILREDMKRGQDEFNALVALRTNLINRRTDDELHDAALEAVPVRDAGP